LVSTFTPRTSISFHNGSDAGSGVNDNWRLGVEPSNRASRPSQARHDLMARTSRRANGFDQRPILVVFPARFFAMSPQKHARSVTEPAPVRQ